MKNYKRLLLTILVLVCGTFAANAGYFGTSVGYLVDGEDEVLAVQLGFPLSQSASGTHNIEVELAYISDSEDSASIDLTPVMLNYVYKTNAEKQSQLHGRKKTKAREKENRHSDTFLPAYFCWYFFVSLWYLCTYIR